MSEPEKQNSEAGSSPVREVPIEWEALEDAFENNAPEVHSYLHLVTGEVLRVVDGIADPEMHTRIASDTTYMRVEPVSSREQYRWMERFIPMVEETGLREQLTSAIDGKGAFRRFKDVLMNFSAERERWFTFRSERLRVFMEAWLATHGLKAVPRVNWAPAEQPSRPQQQAISQEQLTARRSRSAEALRKQLRELAETLGARDLEKVTAFAEFVKARRAARVFPHRHDPSSPMASDGELSPDAGDDDSGDDDSPSSEQRAAALK
ncbi:MAG: UPF0158 family protein [Polyangiaceae bacterium]